MFGDCTAECEAFLHCSTDLWFYIEMFPDAASFISLTPSNKRQSALPQQNKRSNDDRNHSRFLLIPPSVCIFRSSRSLSLLQPLTVLSVRCSCMPLSADPLVQQICSLSLCSQLDRDTSTLRWASRQPSATQLPPPLHFTVSHSPPPLISLIGCLRERRQTSAPAVVTILPPPVSPFPLPLSVWLFYSLQECVTCK